MAAFTARHADADVNAEAGFQRFRDLALCAQEHRGTLPRAAAPADALRHNAARTRAGSLDLRIFEREDIDCAAVAALAAFGAHADQRVDADCRACLEIKGIRIGRTAIRSEEHTSELQSLMPISYAVFCLKKKPTDLT